MRHYCFPVQVHIKFHFSYNSDIRNLSSLGIKFCNGYITDEFHEIKEYQLPQDSLIIHWCIRLQILLWNSYEKLLPLFSQRPHYIFENGNEKIKAIGANVCLLLQPKKVLWQIIWSTLLWHTIISFSLRNGNHPETKWFWHLEITQHQSRLLNLNVTQSHKYILYIMKKYIARKYRNLNFWTDYTIS